MLMQNFGVTNKEHYVMLWYFLEWSVILYRVFSLTWLASMQIYWNKRKRLHKKRVQLPEDWFGTNMAAVSLFWDTYMAAVTSCENTLYLVLSVFSLAKSMQLIFLEVSATYRLVIYLLSVTNL